MRFLFILLLTLSINVVTGGHPLLKGTDPVAQALIEDIMRFPKALGLVNKATSEGMITLSISRNNSMPFSAMWEAGRRQITLDGRAELSWGRLIQNFIFELHNAVTTREDASLMQKARYGQMTCDQYVHGVEKIEHRNMVRTARLLQEGIKAGVFPKDARWDIIHDFDLHYKTQQLSGHSDVIVDQYRDFCPSHFYACPYRGTVQKKRSQWENRALAAELYHNYIRQNG